MKLFVAVILVTVSLVHAEPPNGRPRTYYVKQSAAQTAPYQARGWRPSGPSFNLPVQQQPPVPVASYGPPTTAEPATTTEADTEAPSTVNPQAENIKDDKKSAEKLQEQPNPGQYYVVVPQGQNVVYAVQQTAPLVAVQRENLVQNQKPLVPLQAVPAFPKIQEVPAVQQLQFVPSQLIAPYTASIVQIYQ